MRVRLVILFGAVVFALVLFGAGLVFATVVHGVVTVGEING